MALTIKQQIALRNDGLPSMYYTIDLFSYQTALAVALDYQKNEKVVPMENTEAYSYANKVSGVIGRLYNDREKMMDTLSNMMTATLGNSTYTAAQINGATSAQIEGFFSGEMMTIIENLALVTPNERAEYIAL